MKFPSACLAILLAAGAAHAGPVKGVVNKMIEVPAKQPQEDAGEFAIVVECRGNERTSVLVKGDHKPVADLEIVVYEGASGDAKGKIVATGRGTRDLVGAVWTPPRTMTYRVVIRNPAAFVPRENPHNDCYLTIK